MDLISVAPVLELLGYWEFNPLILHLTPLLHMIIQNSGQVQLDPPFHLGQFEH